MRFLSSASRTVPRGAVVPGAESAVKVGIIPKSAGRRRLGGGGAFQQHFPGNLQPLEQDIPVQAGAHLPAELVAEVVFAHVKPPGQSVQRQLLRVVTVDIGQHPRNQRAVFAGFPALLRGAVQQRHQLQKAPLGAQVGGVFLSRALVQDALQQGAQRGDVGRVQAVCVAVEVEDTVNPGVNMVFPCNEIQKTAWEVLKNFDHALILRHDDPLLPAILKVYEEQGIRDGAPQNQMKGPAFQTELATAYPECRLVVTKETMTVEGMIKIVYDLLKDKLNIAKITFTSGVNAASAEFSTHNEIDRCPLCGIALDENGVCPKCGYKKP